MKLALYHELVPWYRLLDPVDDHQDEAADFEAGFRSVVEPAPRTMLELGAGAGNNAFFLKRAFQCTLTDLSEPMLGLSRDINPECEHILGDMRTLRLGRTFDAVLVHDAIVYMLTEADLRAAVQTAFLHTRPGGAALFAPDCLRDANTIGIEHSELHRGNDGQRALRCLEWTWDPDPTDSTYTVEYAFLLRDGTSPIQAVHDVHIEGLFDRDTWLRILTDAGYRVQDLERPLPHVENPSIYTDQIFLCRRPP